MNGARRFIASETADSAVEVALDLLRSSGPGAVTMDNVAFAAEISNGTLYHHFGSKAGLMRTMARVVAAEYRAEVLGDDIINGHLRWVEDNRHDAELLYRLGEFPAPFSGDRIDHEIRLAPARRIGELWLEGHLPGRPTDYADRLSRS